MALININESKTYHSKTNLNDKLSNLLSANSNQISKIKNKDELIKFIYSLMRENDCIDNNVLSRFKQTKDINDLYEKIYFLILSREGNGVLKEYSMRKCSFKGSAIRGLEIHSSGH